MNIHEYIESGVIERYLLGLTSAHENAELFALRRIYPILDIEFAAAEIRIEEKLLEEGEVPPPVLRRVILNRFTTDDLTEPIPELNTSNFHRYGTPPPTDTYILEPFWKKRMSVSVWWRCVLIAMIIVIMGLAASAWHFYHQSARFEDALIKIKVPSAGSAAP